MSGEPRLRVNPPWIALLGLSLALAAGCAERTTANVAIAETAGEGVAKDIVVLDPTFAKHVKIVDLRVGHAGDLLRAAVIVQNQDDATVPFEYLVEWYDADRLPLDAGIAGWRPERLHGRELKTIQEVSPLTQAVGFKFKVRAPNPTHD